MPTLSTVQAVALQRLRRRNGTRNPRAELREIQAVLLRDIRNPETPPHIRAQCARAFNDCEERLRILNGKPLPGQLRPDLEQRKPRRIYARASAHVIEVSTMPVESLNKHALSQSTHAAHAPAQVGDGGQAVEIKQPIAERPAPPSTPRPPFW